MSAAEYLRQSRAGAAPSMLESTAASGVRKELENMYHTKYILNDDQQRRINKLCGYEVASDYNERLPSCHWELAVMREMARRDLRQFSRIDKAGLRTLVVGAAAREAKMYWDRPNVDFYFHNSEPKDTTRIQLAFLEELSAIYGRHAVVDISQVSHAKKIATQKFNTLQEIIETLKITKGTIGRLYTKLPDKKYSVLVFEDSAYNYSEFDWCDIFFRTEASAAYVIGLYPEEILFPEVPDSGCYVYQTVRGKLDDKTLALAILTFASVQHFFLPGNAYYVVAATISFVQGLLTQDSEFVWTYDAVISKLVGTRIYDVFGLSDQRRLGLLASHIFTYLSSGNDHVELTYPGHSTGYTHLKHTYELLQKKPVIQHPAYAFSLHVELKQRVGPICVFEITRASCRPGPVVVRKQLSPNARYVKILDVPASLAKVTKLKMKEPKYIAVNRIEFFSVANFLAGQKLEAISLGMAMTMLKRASEGMSVGNQTYMEPWSLDVGKIFSVALTAVMYALSRSDFYAMATNESFRKMVTEEKSRWLTMLTTLVGAATSLATAGLVVPIFGLFEWLREEVIRNPLVIDDEPYVIQRHNDPAWTIKAQQTGLGASHCSYLDHQIDVHPRGKTCEEECDFTQTMGDMGPQRMYCLHEHGAKTTEFSYEYSAEEVAVLRTKLTVQRDAATNDGIYNAIDGFVDKLDEVRNGFKHKLNVEVLVGGPGVGKSYTARSYMNSLNKRGKSTFVYAPFRKLAPDYTVEKDGVGPFDFYTMHGGYKVGKRDVMVVDEYTSLDEDLLLCTAFFTSTTDMLLLGDELQTGLRATEGKRIFSLGSGLSLDNTRRHILTTQFRSDAWTVAVLNREFGYNLYAKTSEYTKPVFYDEEELADFPEIPVMTFSRATGEDNIGLEQANTVRANQGGTYDFGTNLLVDDRDVRLMDVQGMLIVAISRHRAGTPFRIFGNPGPAMDRLRRVLHDGDKEFESRVTEFSRPDVEGFYREWRDKQYGKAETADNSEVLRKLAAAGIALDVATFKEPDMISISSLLDKLVVSPDAVKVALLEEERAAIGEALQEAMQEGETGRKFGDDYETCTYEALQSSITIKHKGKEVLFSADRSDLLRKYETWVRQRVPRQNGVKQLVPERVFISFLKAQEICAVLYDWDHKALDVVGGATFDMLMTQVNDRYRAALFLKLTQGHVEVMSEADLSAITKRYTWDFGKGRQISFRQVDKISDICNQGLRVSWGHYAYDKGETLISHLFDGNGYYVPGRTELFLRAFGKSGLYGVDEKFVEQHVSDVRNDYAKLLTSEFVNHVTDNTAIIRERLLEEGPVLQRDISSAQDMYLCGGLVDKQVSENVRTNALGASVGSKVKQFLKRLNTNSLIVDMTKNGTIRQLSEYGRAFSAGDGLTQTNCPVETVGSASRYTVAPVGPRPSLNGIRAATKMARLCYYDGFDPKKRLPEDVLRFLHVGFVGDAVRRNYDGRAESMYNAGMNERVITYMNKRQFKPRKNGTIKEDKVGQGISATSSATNLRFGSLYRQATAQYFHAAYDWNIFDCFTTDDEFFDRFNQQLKRVPSCATSVTTDAKEFDSKQNWFSNAAEVELDRLLTGTDMAFCYYSHYVRRNYPISCPGLFSAKVAYAKPSGAPDTLYGNTKVSEIFAHSIIKGKGPKVRAKKGDDLIQVQYGARIDEKGIATLRCYSPLELTVIFGDTEFCGKVITKAGMFPNVVRTARKALAHWNKQYKTFAEYQIALRDTVRRIYSCGYNGTIHASAKGSKVSVAVAEAAFGIVQSLSHISEEQWEAGTHVVEHNRPVARTASGRIRPFGW